MQAIAKRPLFWQIIVLFCIFTIIGLSSCDRPPSTPATPAPPPERPPATVSTSAAPVVTPPPAEPVPAPEEPVAVKKEPEPPVQPPADPAPAAPASTEAEQPASPDAKELVKKSDDLMRGDTVQGIYIMEITTPNWNRMLELDVSTKARDRVFIRILSPAKEAGTGTLRIDNEMWNFLPRIEKVIKIPPSLMLQSWMGSDFANDDLVKQNSIVEDYTHRIVGEETLNGHATYKVELIPKPGAAVIWGKLYHWIRPGDYVPIRQDFYDERGRLVKRLDYSDIEQVSDRTVPRTWLMTNLLKEGKSTRIYLKDVTYNQPVDDNIFTLPNLKRLK